MLRLVLVDDEDLMRNGLRLVLDGAPDIDIVGEASNGRDAVAVIEKTDPDVVLMDIRMPVMDGITALRTLYSAQPLDRRTPVVMLTAFDTDAFILDALRAGAIGFLLKTTKPEALVAAVRAGAAGQQILSPQILPKLMAAESAGDQEETASKEAESTGTKKTALACLSQREKEIAQLVAEGLNNSEIAQRLYISTTTVKTHIKHIMDKLEVTNRIHIAIAVLEAR